MKLYANLHLHSNHSDGPYTPEELVAVAKKEGYQAVALSDHDTISGCPLMEAECKKQGMEFIFACEFTAKNPSAHIVAFDFDPEYPEMKEYLRQMSERETHKTKTCFDWAVEDGGIQGISWEEVLDFNKGVTWLCNNHVFEAMKAKGLVQQSGYMDFFTRNFAKQRGKVQNYITQKDAKDMISLIHAAGGIAVWAHPNGRLHLLPEMLEAGIDGLEVWHADLADREERRQAYELAVAHNLYISGGSDHSGLCGGYYSGFESEEALKNSPFFIPEMSTGTTEVFFRELKNRKKTDRSNLEFDPL